MSLMRRCLTISGSDNCPFAGNGCYAESGPLGYLWAGMSAAGPNSSFKNGRSYVQTTDWTGLCASVAALPPETIWRHNQAGDLPHVDGKIDGNMVDALVMANRGKRGFTYTHHDMSIDGNAAIVAAANFAGLTINLSGNTLEHADELADREIAPVVCVLPASVHGKTDIATPKGRRVVVPGRCFVQNLRFVRGARPQGDRRISSTWRP